MTSKKLGALLRSVPPATAPADREEPAEVPTPAAAPAAAVAAVSAPVTRWNPAPAATVEPEVPLQVLIPANIRKQLAMMSAEQGESLRALMLRAIRGLGVTVSDAEIKGKRGRKNS
jgi:hypothetical protein